MSCRIRSRSLVAPATLVALTAAAITCAAPAAAKSTLQLSVTPTTVEVGQAVHLVLVGSNDAVGGYSEVCVQGAVGSGTHVVWADMRCSHPVADTHGPASLRTTIVADHGGTIRLRGRLVATDAHGGHRRAEQATPVSVVHVRPLG